MVTGGWKASNIFSFSPSFLFFLLLEDEHHHSIFKFFHVIILFWRKTSNINLQFSFFIPSCFLFWSLAIIIIQISPFFFLLHILHTLRRAPSPPRLSRFGWDLPLPSQSPSHLLLRVQNKKRLDNRGERFQYKGEGWNIWDKSKINYDISSVKDSFDNSGKHKLYWGLGCYDKKS